LYSKKKKSFLRHESQDDRGQTRLKVSHFERSTTYGQVGHGGVSAHARNQDLESLAGSEDRSRSAGDDARREGRPNVQAECVLRFGRELQYALFPHPFGPGPSLFGGLELSSKRWD